MPATPAARSARAIEPSLILAPVTESRASLLPLTEPFLSVLPLIFFAALVIA